MVWTQRNQIPSIGWAVVFPVDDVMHLDEPVLCTARHPTAAVTQGDDAAGAFRDDALATPNRYRDTVDKKCWGDEPVTGDVTPDRVR